jgi:hypothetical protein
LEIGTENVENLIAKFGLHDTRSKARNTFPAILGSILQQIYALKSYANLMHAFGIIITTIYN